MTKLISILVLVTIVFSSSACRSKTKKITSGTVAGVTVDFYNSDGTLRRGNNDLRITFTDSSGKPVDAGAVSIDFYKPATATTRVLNNQAKVTKTETVGSYQVKAKLDAAGPWQVNIAFEGPTGTGKGSFPIAAQ